MLKKTHLFLTLLGSSAVLAVLWWLLSSLAFPPATLIQGADQISRYAMGAQASGAHFWLVPDDVRAANVFQWFPYISLAWCTLGASLLWLLLRHTHVRWMTAAVASLCFAAAGASQAYGLADVVWLAAAAGCALLAALRWWRSCPNAATQPQMSGARWMSALSIWALWLLLMGMGVLWLSDLATRGPISLRYLGVRQLDAVWLSVFVVMPLAACSGQRFLTFLLRVLALWKTQRGPLILSIGFVALMLALVWLGAQASFGDLRGFPHISSELVRVLCALAVAWVMARYHEWGAGLKRSMGSSGLALLVLMGCLAVLVVTKDLGPVLALAIALVPLILVLLAPSVWSMGRVVHWCLVVSVWLLAAIMLRYLLADWLPAQPWAPERLVLRQEAMVDPFSARLDYGSQIAWLREAAGPHGFGLGLVPWCGARAYLGLAACTKSSGVPVQFGSDYVHTAISALWGDVGAALVLLLSCLLIAMVVWRVSSQQTLNGAALSTSRLRAWLVVVFAAMLMGQLLVSVSGNLGLIPLSGVTQPFLGLGTVTLISSAAWMGLALGRLGEDAPTSGWLSSSLHRYFGIAVLGMALFLAGAAIWHSAASHQIKDRLTPQVVIEGLELLRASTAQAGRTGASAPMVSSLTVSEPACPVQAQQVEAVVARLSQHVDRSFNLGVMSCKQAQALVAASLWALDRSSSIAAKQVLKPNPNQIGVTNPYRLSGCIRLADDANGKAAEPSTALPCPAQQNVVRRLLQTSPQLVALLSAVTTSVRGPEDATGVAYRHVPQVIPVDRLQPPAWAKWIHADSLLHAALRQPQSRSLTLGQGASVTLSVTQQQQAIAQGLVDCYVGPCQVLSGDQTQGANMLESARARMASLLVVDVASGMITAAASAHSRCHAYHHQGQIGQGCIELPQRPAVRPWELHNQALHGEAMCGSICKIVQGLALLRVSSPLTHSQEDFTKAVRESQTERFIDEFLCVDKGFEPACAQRRLSALAKAANDLGARHACPQGDISCQTHGINVGPRREAMSVPRLRLLSNPKGASISLLTTYPPGSKSFTPDAVKACFAQGKDKRWRGCHGEGLVAHVAELFGQGNATTSPAGVAAALTTLANSAQLPNGAPTPQLSLVDSAESMQHVKPNQVEQVHAQRLLDALLEPLKQGGTAHASCLKAINPDGMLNCDNTGQWVIAGKTGTPLFPHDAWTHQMRARECARVASQPDSMAKRHQWARCLVPPTKWYAYLLGKHEEGRIKWVKAVVVLSERNWHATTGLVDTPFDRGGNVAAEIGLRMARILTEQATQSARQQEPIDVAAP
jgi:cell division protein FtsW (lipid II flippase)